jgi:hypothetical protein
MVSHHSRWRDLNPQPRLYESRALPLSYIGEIRLYHTKSICSMQRGRNISLYKSFDLLTNRV